MADLIYSAITSLDGYIADATGTFDWAAPDDEVHAFVNERERPIGTYLYGRRMYEVMAGWQTMTATDPVGADFADLWRAADKIVYSSTLAEVNTDRTTLARDFVADRVAALKDAADRDISIGGATLAAAALRAGLVDRVELFLTPVVVGGGTAALPDDVRIPLDLVDLRRFHSGVVYLHYAIRA